MKKSLEKIGFDPKEIAVYLALLELGQTTVARISKKSGVQRTTAYDVIESLKEKGLVGRTISHGKTFYFAEDPRTLERLLEEKQSILAGVMPELLSITNFLDKKPKIRFYEDVAGIKEIYYDTFNMPEDKIDVWYPSTFTKDFDMEFFTKDYVPKRIKKKIRTRAISPSTPDMQEYTEGSEYSLREVKFINSEAYDIEVVIMLYGRSKTAIISPEENVGLIIDSPKIHNSLRKIFAFMWEVIPSPQKSGQGI